MKAGDLVIVTSSAPYSITKRGTIWRLSRNNHAEDLRFRLIPVPGIDYLGWQPSPLSYFDIPESDYKVLDLSLLDKFIYNIERAL